MWSMSVTAPVLEREATRGRVVLVGWRTAFPIPDEARRVCGFKGCRRPAVTYDFPPFAGTDIVVFTCGWPDHTLRDPEAN